jgi:hypothetical protein
LLVASSGIRVGAGAGLRADWSLEAGVAARRLTEWRLAPVAEASEAAVPCARAGLGAGLRLRADRRGTEASEAAVPCARPL